MMINVCVVYNGKIRFPLWRQLKNMQYEKERRAERTWKREQETNSIYIQEEQNDQPAHS